MTPTQKPLHEKVAEALAPQIDDVLKDNTVSRAFPMSFHENERNVGRWIYNMGYGDSCARTEKLKAALVEAVKALEVIVCDGHFAAHATARYLEAGRPKQNVEKTDTPMRMAKGRAELALAAIEQALGEG